MLLRLLVCLITLTSPLMLPASDNLTLSAKDAAFIQQIAHGCAAEIRTATAILKHALPDAERDFAKQVVEVHMTVQRVLATIAVNKQACMTDEVLIDEQVRHAAPGDPARESNASFLRGVIQREGAEVALFEVELRDGTDEDLKLFARTYLPGLRKLLVIAKDLGSRY